MRDCYTGPRRIRRIDAASAWLSGSCRPWYGCFATTAPFMVWFSFVVGTRLASTGSSHHRSDRMGWMYLPARRAAAVGATVGAGPRPRRRQTGLHRPGTPALGRRRSARGTGLCRSYHFLFLRPSWRRSVAPPCTASQIFANALDPSSSTGTHCEPASLMGMALLG